MKERVIAAAVFLVVVVLIVRDPLGMANVVHGLGHVVAQIGVFFDAITGNG